MTFASLEDVKTLSGRDFTIAEEERIEALLPLIEDLLRNEAEKVGKNLDAMAEGNNSYANVVKTVVVDVAIRVIRQSTTAEPLVQESQAGLGYSWSGTYAIPGGGIAQAIMNNDLKRLGLKRQQYGVIKTWENSEA